MKEKEKLFNELKILFIIFLIGCFAGFIYEEIFYLITEDILEKRGFLYGIKDGGTILVYF